MKAAYQIFLKIRVTHRHTLRILCCVIYISLALYENEKS